MNHTTQPGDDLAGSVAETLHDLRELAAVLPGDTEHHRAGNAIMADRLAEELADVAAALRALPGRPLTMPGHERLLLASLRRSHDLGEEVSSVLAVALARLAAELGSSAAVLANRPGSWEAGHVARLLAGTVGEDDEQLPAFRQPPLPVRMRVSARIPLVVQYVTDHHVGTFAEMGAALGCSPETAAYTTKDAGAALAAVGLVVTTGPGGSYEARAWMS